MTYPPPRRFHLIALLVALGVCIGSTWPVAIHVRDHVVDGARMMSPKDPGTWWAQAIGADVLTTAWILNWDLHAVVTQPLHLFDANIFYPAPLTLARSEHMFATALLGAPGALSGGPVTAHQTALLLCALFNVWAASYVIVRWSGSLAGGLVSGILFAVSPFHQSQMPHLQSQGTAYFPLMLLAVDRIAAGGARRWVALGAGALALQMLSGQYLAFFAIVTWALAAVAALAIGPPGDGSVFARLRQACWLALGTAAAALVVVPFAIPYLRLAAAGELPDNSQGWLSIFGMQLRDYLLPLHPTPSERGAWVLIAPGALSLALLGILALARGGRSGIRRLAMLSAVGLAGVLFSVGPKPSGLGLYAVAIQVLPGFRTLREPGRFALMPHFAIAMLAGCGAAALVRRLPRIGTLLVALLVASALARYWRGPVPLRSMPVGPFLPPAYRFLAQSGGGDPLLELPALPFPQVWRDAEPVFFSTFHWLPLLNGRSGYPPASYPEILRLAAKLPEPAALERLRALTAVRWLLVHCDAEALHLPQMAFLCSSPTQIPGSALSFGDTRLYDLGRSARHVEPAARSGGSRASRRTGRPGSQSKGAPTRLAASAGLCLSSQLRVRPCAT